MRRPSQSGRCSSSIDDLRDDLAAFADEPEEVLIEANGQALFTRAGQEIACRFEIQVDGSVIVDIAGKQLPYRQFLTRHLAQLDVLAERLVARRPGIEAFVDGNARLETGLRGSVDGRALDLLREECETGTPFMASVTFITADAGQGKTALLREFQHRQAKLFLNNASQYLFWHVDLQGRQLLRLSEALMGDLAELRIVGLWMSTVVRLLRHRALVLAIDGFDELAAEQGSTDALGALALLVTQLEGQGRIVAASRRTFFDTEDYLRRAGLVKRSVARPTEFNQIALGAWTETEALAYLELVQPDDPMKRSPKRIYRDLVNALGGAADHPMVTRPFLLAHIVKGVQRYKVTPAQFLRHVDDPQRGVAAVVDAFIEREVKEKWRYKDTGEPYLSVEQHLVLLAAIAEEMYRSQRDRLDLDVIEAIASALLDDWNIEPIRRQQVADMVRMHVLLTPPADGDARARGFDHPEFREYFVARALQGILERAAVAAVPGELSRFLSVAQISDATARYVCSMLNRRSDITVPLIEALTDAVRREKRLTFLQVNAGTIIPHLLDAFDAGEVVTVDCPAVYSSVVFEGKKLRAVRVMNGTLLNASLANLSWTDVRLIGCDLGELTIGPDATFVEVVFEECSMGSVRLVVDTEDAIVREYAPSRINESLAGRGIAVEHQGAPVEVEATSDSAAQRMLRRFLRLFQRSTVVSLSVIQQRFQHDNQYLLDELIPLLERHGLIEEREWRGGGHQRLWGIRARIEDILAAEDGVGSEALQAFWAEVRRL